MITMMYASSLNHCIAKDNKLPFKSEEDLAMLKAGAKNKIVVVGSKTFKAMGSRPLPDTRTIVLSSNPDYHPEGVEVMNVPIITLTFFVNLTRNDDRDVLILGGSEVYLQCESYASAITHTQFQQIVDGDVFYKPSGRYDIKLSGELAPTNDAPRAYIYTYERR